MAKKATAVKLTDKQLENVAGTMILGSLVCPIAALLVKSPRIKYREGGSDL